LTILLSRQHSLLISRFAAKGSHQLPAQQVRQNAVDRWVNLGARLFKNHL
jgi:hypothetical protein